MKFKNINPVERYFEKVTLAIAAAAAIYFVYSNYFEDTNWVKGIAPGRVESVITKEIISVESQKDRQPKIEVINGTNVPPPSKPPIVAVMVPDWVTEYRLFGSKPLEPTLMASIPMMGPSQLAVIAHDLGSGPTVPPIALPEVAALTDPEMESGRILALRATHAGAAAKPEDITYVQGKAVLPLQALRDSVSTTKIPAYAPRQTAIYRIHVQRQDLHSDGTWSDWTDLPPLPINPLPEFKADGIKDDKDLADRLVPLRAQVFAITEPAFYPAVTITPEAGPRPIAPVPAPSPRQPNAPVHRTSPQPGVTSRNPSYNSSPAGFGGSPPVGGPFPGRIPDPSQQLAAERAIHAQQSFNIPGTPLAPGTPPALLGNTPLEPGGVAPQAAIAVAGDPIGIPDDKAATWFWDDQVKPEHTYRYRARIEMINPLFRLPKPLTTVPAAGANQLVLANNDWTEFKEITIDADEYFYLTHNSLGNNGDLVANFEIYKWHQGGWVMVIDRVECGLALGGAQAVRMGTGKESIKVDFGTTFTVVDVRSIAGNSGEDQQVVLLNNSTGQLILHNLLADEANAQRQKLKEFVERKPGTP